MKVADFGTNIRGEIRKMVRRAHKNLLRNNPGRLSGMSYDFNNLATIAIQLGYPIGLLSPQLRGMVEAMSLRAHLPTTISSLSNSAGDAGTDGSAQGTPTKGPPSGSRAARDSTTGGGVSLLAIGYSPADATTPTGAAREQMPSSSSSESTKKKRKKAKKAKKAKKEKKVSKDVAPVSLRGETPMSGSSAEQQPGALAPPPAGQPTVTWSVPPLDMSSFPKAASNKEKRQKPTEDRAAEGEAAEVAASSDAQEEKKASSSSGEDTP